MILQCTGLDVHYGPVQVIFGVNFAVEQGEIVALLGINGAGKSTLLRSIAGLLPAASGTITFDGADITRIGAENAARLGISMVPGGRGIFPSLSVEDNLRVAAWTTRHERALHESARERVLSMFPVLEVRKHQLAGNLSGGEQQMLTIAQSLITRPRLLIIDELSLGLAPVVVGQLMECVRAIHASGTTIVLVEQSLNVALELCQRAVFMEKGEVKYDGPSRELRSRPDLVRSVFLGQRGAPDDDARAPESPPSSPTVGTRPADSTKDSYRLTSPPVRSSNVLEVRDVSVHFGGIRALDGVDLDLGDGEILGLLGANGAGKTTLFDVISGFLVPDSGSVLLRGIDVTSWSPNRRGWAGLGRSFQDATLFPSLTVHETVAVALERFVEVRDPLSAVFGLPISRDSEEDVVRRVDELLLQTGLCEYSTSFLYELSTGTRRIVDIACCLAHGPDVLLLDEPAAGIAQKETEALAPRLKELRDATGVSLLVIEHDMPLVRSLCDRVIVLDGGSEIARGTPDEVMMHASVMSAYLGGDITAIERSGSDHGSGAAIGSSGTLR